MSTPLIILFISAGFIIIGAFLWQKGNHLLKYGKRVKAIVHENKYSRSKDGVGIYTPVVRFKTDKGEWITHELSIGYSTATPEGTEIEVLYDPEEPTTVERNSSAHLEFIPRVMVLLGILGFIFGTFEYLDIIDLIQETNSDTKQASILPLFG